jgi:nucleoside-diphosphate-sugar epimerase
MGALLLFFQDRSRTPPFALGENTRRGGWEGHQEHLTRRKALRAAGYQEPFIGLEEGIEDYVQRYLKEELLW